MADTSSQRIPPGKPIADDDPFAELTRIMGFDPRVKVQPAQAVDSDFDLDLERELMGEFASNQDNHRPNTRAEEAAAAPLDPSLFEPIVSASAASKPLATEKPLAAEEPGQGDRAEAPAPELMSGPAFDEPEVPSAVAPAPADSRTAGVEPAENTAARDEDEFARHEDAALFAPEREDEPLSDETDASWSFSALQDPAQPSAPDNAVAQPDYDEIQQVYAALAAWEKNLQQGFAPASRETEPAPHEPSVINESVPAQQEDPAFSSQGEALDVVPGAEADSHEASPAEAEVEPSYSAPFVAPPEAAEPPSAVEIAEPEGSVEGIGEQEADADAVDPVEAFEASLIQAEAWEAEAGQQTEPVLLYEDDLALVLDDETVSSTQSEIIQADDPKWPAADQDPDRPSDANVIPGGDEDFANVAVLDALQDLNFDLEHENGADPGDEHQSSSTLERDVFTAEEGWTDEPTVALDEPQFLAQLEAEPEEEPRSGASAGPEDWELIATPVHEDTHPAASHDPDFERELLDLLGEDMDDAPRPQTSGAADDSWLDAIDFADASEAGASGEDGQGTANGDALDEDALWQLDLPVQAAAPVSASESFALPDLEEHLGSEEHHGGPSAADTAGDEPGLGDFELAGLFADDLAEREHGIVLDADPQHRASPADPEGGSFNALDIPTQRGRSASPPDHVDPSSAIHQTEPDAMQPFDERTFDAALADELALDSYKRASDRDRVHAAAAAYGYANAGAPRSQVNAPGMHSEVPDIETVDFVDQRLAHSDELDLPDFDYGREQKPAVNAFDDFDAEFASAFNSLNDEAARRPTREEDFSQRAAPQSWDDNFDLSLAATGAAAGAATASYPSTLSRAGMYEPDEEEDLERLQRTQQRASPVRRRGLLIAGAAAAIVLIGGVALIAMPGNPIGGGEPAIVRADSDPMKVRPENPGGTTVPNQDNVVYDRVGSGQPLGAPTQERLISTAEAPVDLNATEDEDVSLGTLSALDAEGSGFEDADADPVGAAAKGEDRLEPTPVGSSGVPEEMVAVAPRKVRTMVVRPDGTLAPREDAAVAAAEPPVEIASVAQAAISPTPAASTQPAPVLPEPAASAAAAAPLPLERGADAPVAAAPEPAARPAPEPTPAPQVAAVEPAAAPQASAAAAAPSGWAVQIASQPSEAAAQASYESLSRRYASVLGGRGVNIVKADIAGKGTYYRVRIPASSRAEANTICANYKSAGGSCFVSQ